MSLSLSAPSVNTVADDGPWVLSFFVTDQLLLTSSFLFLLRLFLQVSHRHFLFYFFIFYFCF